MTNPIFVTGAAGFIGFHTSLRILNQGIPVVGLDNLNDYYDVELKKSRLRYLQECPGFNFLQADLADKETVLELFKEYRFKTVINLAAQAGVRYSLTNPDAYIDSNIVGFTNILEACRHYPVEHLVYASSSSVYGANTKMPFSVSDNVDHPISLYAATKKSNELMAHTYSHLYNIPTTGLRFFTVYGPWGRPDMALFKFTKAILAGQPIEVYNYGQMKRDFTYIDDIVEGILRVCDHVPTTDPNRVNIGDPSTGKAPYRVFNIGNDQPVALMDMIETLEKALGQKAEKQMLPLQPGDVTTTWADIDALKEAVGFSPNTPLEEGIKKFVEWYKAYYA
ncbi:MAG: NAD-dependent epimerase [Chlamydiota bacterium]